MRTVADITLEIRDLNATGRDLRIAMYRLLVEAKDHFERVDNWVAWGASELSLCRRQMFNACAIVEVLDWADGEKGKSAPGCTSVYDFADIGNLNTLVELNRIDPGRRAAFLYETPSFCRMTRDAARDAVNIFLGRSNVPAPRQPSLPEPEQLLLGLDDARVAREIRMETEGKYVVAHLRRVAAAIAHQQVSVSRIEGFKSELGKVLQDLDAIVMHHAVIPREVAS